MISRRLAHVLACSSAALALSACGMFGSKSSPAVAATGTQQFDPYSNSWKPSNQVVKPPPSEPNATLAEQEAASKRENSTVNKAGRVVSNSVSAVGRVVKKPLGWLPFGKKDTDSGEEAKTPVQ